MTSVIRPAGARKMPSSLTEMPRICQGSFFLERAKLLTVS
jgi:hypothetical protein